MNVPDGERRTNGQSASTKRSTPKVNTGLDFTELLVPRSFIASGDGRNRSGKAGQPGEPAARVNAPRVTPTKRATTETDRWIRAKNAGELVRTCASPRNSTIVC